MLVPPDELDDLYDFDDFSMDFSMSSDDLDNLNSTVISRRSTGEPFDPLIWSEQKMKNLSSCEDLDFDHELFSSFCQKTFEEKF